MQGSQQQQAVVIPTNTGYVSQPYQTTSEVSSYANRQSTVIGILLVIMGALSIVFNIVDIAVGSQRFVRYYSYGYYTYLTLAQVSNGVAAHGFWCGILVVLAGGFGIGAGRHKTRCLIITFLVFAIIGCVLSIIQMIVAAAGAGNVSKIWYCGQSCMNDVNTVYAMEVMIALLGVGEFALCLWGSIICCSTGGCCARSQTTVVAMPIGQPQVTVISQQQQQPQAYQPQQVVYPAPPMQYPAAYPPQYTTGYPPQNPAGYPPQNPAGYPPQNPAGYPTQNPAGFTPEKPAGYPPQ